MLRHKLRLGGGEFQAIETIGIALAADVKENRLEGELRMRLRAKGFGHAGALCVDRMGVCSAWTGIRERWWYCMRYPTDVTGETRLTAQDVANAAEEIEIEIAEAIKVRDRLTMLEEPDDIPY